MEHYPQMSNTVNFIILQNPMTTTSPLTGKILKPILPSTSKPSAGVTPPIKPAKKLRNEDNEILRCKRRLDFAKLGLPFQRPNPVTVARRNARERNRVKLINNTFCTLRDHLPNVPTATKNNKKSLSKVDTLRSAIDYIRSLQELLDEHDAVNAAFNGNSSLPRALTVSTVNSTIPAVSSPSSTSSYSSDNVSEPPLSPEEEELLDFTSWF